MAQRVVTVLVDDIDESEADETVVFTLDGRDYSIDLNAAHAAELRDAFALYVGNGRSATGQKKDRRRPSGNGRTAQESAAIREWAQANGLEVSQRGRISVQVLDANDAAN